MTQSARPIDLWLRPALALTFFVTIVGCGQNGPSRYQVSGTVSYAGKPVPKGDVIIEPDPAKSNKGPQARAFIVNGKFETQPGKGAVAGPAIFRVQAFDGTAHPESPNGSALGSPFELRVDLPAADSTQDLVIPGK